MFSKTLLTLTALVGATLSAPAPAELNTRVVDGVKWTVKGFTRVCDSYSHSCTYNFRISAGAYTPDSSCKVIDTVYGYDDPKTHSWYSYPCNNEYGGYVISWGYNPAYDSAVMTVVSQPLQEDAWFGWNNVSATTNLPDVGPNPVYALGTFN